MEVLDAGHRYRLQGNKDTDAQEVTPRTGRATMTASLCGAVSPRGSHFCGLPEGHEGGPEAYRTHRCSADGCGMTWQPLG